MNDGEWYVEGTSEQLSREIDRIGTENRLLIHRNGKLEEKLDLLVRFLRDFVESTENGYCMVKPFHEQAKDLLKQLGEEE